MERKCEILHDLLSKLSQQELDSFTDHFDQADAYAYSWPLWAAAYILNGGCSDDSFSDFRATLISMGQTTFENALRDPETLATVRFHNGNPCYEGFQYVPSMVAKSVFGRPPVHRIPLPDEPSGDPWEEEAVDELFPLLATSVIAYRKAKTPDTKQPWWKIF